MARAEFAVPDAGQPPQWLEEAQARLMREKDILVRSVPGLQAVS